MSPATRAATGFVRVAGLCLLACVAGCSSRSASRDGGLALDLPPGWSRVDTGTYLVPGTPLSAYRGPEGSSLVAYRTLPVPGATAAALGAELANRMENLPGVRAVDRGEVEVAGRKAARVALVAAGTGDALAPTGTGEPKGPEGKPLVDTRRICVGLPDPGGAVWLCWHFPESSRPRREPEVASMLKTVRLDARAAVTSSY